MTAVEPGWSDAALGALRPLPRRTVSQWADAERYLPEGTTPTPGRWRTDRIPALREILDSLSDPTVEEVAVCGCSQGIGKTDGIALNAIGAFTADDPSPIMVVCESEKKWIQFSQQRLDKLFAATPCLSGLLDQRQKSSRNKTNIKMFDGGYVVGAWAGSISTLSSWPIRIVIGDEVDLWPVTAGRGQSPIEQARQRTSNFYNRKHLWISTPTIEGQSGIWQLFLDGDRRYRHVPCPRCGTMFVMLWEHVVYRDAQGRPDPENAYLRCPHCEGTIRDHERHEMDLHGEWIPQRPEVLGRRSYQLSALYSPYVRLATLAAQWLRVVASRDQAGVQDFMNLRLGLPAPQAGTVIHVEAMEMHRERYPEGGRLPAAVLLLTCQVDTQDAWLEWEVCGWDATRGRWGVQTGRLAGDTSQPAVWARLDELLARRWETEDGRELAVRCMVVDAGGHRTDEVWAYTKPRGHRGVYAIMGRQGDGKPVVGKPSVSNRAKCPTFPVGSYTAKNAVFAALQVERDEDGVPGAGYWHWPDDPASGYDLEYFRGLLSERRETRRAGGRDITKWVVIYKRNEPLDLAQYSLAALSILDPDLPALAKRQAARLARQGAPRARTAQPAKATASAGPSGLPPATPRPPAPAPRQAKPARRGPPRRRILSRGIR